MLQNRTEFAILRERAGLSMEETAALIHVSERTIRRYETFGESGSA
jgi:predicted transcriptional regulator